MTLLLIAHRVSGGDDLQESAPQSRRTLLPAYFRERLERPSGPEFDFSLSE